MWISCLPALDVKCIPSSPLSLPLLLLSSYCSVNSSWAIKVQPKLWDCEKDNQIYWIKSSCFKTSLASFFLPGVSISPILPTISIVHVQATTVHSSTQPVPSPCLPDEHHHDMPDVDQAKELQEPATSPDILTRHKFVKIMEWDLFKPPWSYTFCSRHKMGPLQRLPNIVVAARIL